MDARLLLLGLACVLGSLVAVHGHGYMLQPAARGLHISSRGSGTRRVATASAKATQMAQYNGPSKDLVGPVVCDR
jgi:predicted carbohydrate-binding protein with CBM5 and CBM33 domain